MADYSQEQLEHMVVGKPEKPRAVFFEKAVLNHAESKRQGRRVYDTKLYVKVTQPGITDWVAYKAQPKDLQDFQAEYNFYQNNKQGTRKAGVDIIPGLQIAHYQELLDMHLSTVEQLAEAEVIPPHLEYARKIAISLNKVMKESEHGQEEGIEKAGTGISAGSEEGREAEAVPAPAGRIDPDRVGRREPATRDAKKLHEAPRGLRQSGCFHGGESIDNWSVTFGG